MKFGDVPNGMLGRRAATTKVMHGAAFVSKRRPADGKRLDRGRPYEEYEGLLRRLSYGHKRRGWFDGLAMDGMAILPMRQSFFAEGIRHADRSIWDADDRRRKTDLDAVSTIGEDPHVHNQQVDHLDRLWWRRLGHLFMLFDGASSIPLDVVITTTAGPGTLPAWFSSLGIPVSSARRFIPGIVLGAIC
jgi:hypothetical protein